MSAIFILCLNGAFAGDSEALFAAAVDHEQNTNYAAAYRSCEQLIEVDPKGFRAPSCRRRLAHWGARADDNGTFEGLQHLQYVRNNRTRRGADQSRADLAELAQSGGLSPTLEIEIAIWLADDALRHGDPGRAAELSKRALAAGVGVEERLLIHLRGLRDRALGITAAAIRDRWRARVTLGAGIVYSGLLALGIPLAVVGWRRERPVPWGVVPIAIGTVGAGWIANYWAPGAGTAAWVAGVLFVGVHLIAVGNHAWLRSSPDRSRLKLSVRVGAAFATLAGLWLAVDAADAYSWMGW